MGAALDAEAVRRGLTAGALAREALASSLPDVPAVAAVPVRAYRAPNPAPAVDVVEVARLREAVGEAVGTLRQVAGLDRSRDGARLPEIDGALSRLLALAADLDAAKADLLQRPAPEPAG